ncbi:iron-sulfur cluster biosynthesis family protein [Aneurinibacillus tyrosinisolvens]|uniref:iron-sulfur cluster biosynthesis family protein n=1 Tax=Aneurinibacillus tyrosinisolvens TaxID=1443435 RepID=UPI00063F3AE7|nr:iron-sulfur cluster biosynthesis family protein [Aneurinibacillus tyrosinisolvens]
MGSIAFTLTPEAAQAYKKYAGFNEGEIYRLYTRTSGPGTGGLFYALEKSGQDEVQEEDAVFQVEGICFFIRPADFWYFNGGTLSHDRYMGEYGFEFRNPLLD